MEKRLWTPQEATEFLSKNSLPAEIQKAAESDLRRIEAFPIGSSEFSKAQARFDWLVNMPWEHKPAVVDLGRIEGVFNQAIYAQDEAKTQLASHLVTRPIGCSYPLFYLLGSPGTGKSRLAEAVGIGLDRPIFKIRASTIRHEADLSGRDEPGAVAKIFRDCGRLDPVIIIEDAHEIPEECPLLNLIAAFQEGSWYEDKFLGVRLDLSNVIIIATGHVNPAWLEAVPSHVEVIDLHTYTLQDKVEIAGRFIIPEACKWMGMKKPIMFHKEAVEFLSIMHTSEVGTRRLRDKILSILRRVELLKYRQGKKIRVIRVKDVTSLIGTPKCGPSEFPHDGVGKTNGMAWTGSGGELMPIQVALVAATEEGAGGEITLTGNLGSVLKESAQVALTFIRSHTTELKIPKGAIENHNFHIHLQDGSTPKDGPSAGLALAVALVSALRNKPVKPSIAMTGEINLSGELAPIGGLQEKIEAALKLQVKTILVPRRNYGDLMTLRNGLCRYANVRVIDKVEDAILLCVDGKKKVGDQVKVTVRSRRAKKVTKNEDLNRTKKKRIVAKKKKTKKKSY